MSKDLNKRALQAANIAYEKTMKPPKAEKENMSIALKFKKAESPDQEHKAWIASGPNFVHLIIEMPIGGYMLRVYDPNSLDSGPIMMRIRMTKIQCIAECQSFEMMNAEGIKESVSMNTIN